MQKKIFIKIEGKNILGRVCPPVCEGLRLQAPDCFGLNLPRQLFIGYHYLKNRNCKNLKFGLTYDSENCSSFGTSKDMVFYRFSSYFEKKIDHISKTKNCYFIGFKTLRNCLEQNPNLATFEEAEDLCVVN